MPRKDAHWAVQQVQGSANWSSGSRWSNWLSGGLNHQIEHHLFPSMSIYLYPTISPVVRQTCAELGISPRQAIAVGDGANDLPMLGEAGLSVAYHAKPKVREQAMVQINAGGLDRLLEVVR